MGSAQSYLPVAAVVAGAAAYGYVQLQRPSAAALPHAGPSSSSSTPVSTSASSAKKQKQKKKGGAGAGAAPSEKEKDARPAEANVVAFPPVVPGSFDTQSPAIPSETQSKPKNKKKKAKKAGAGGADAQSESSATAPESSTAPRMTKPKKGGASSSRQTALEDGGWTKVETKKKPTKAGAAVAGEAEGSGSQAHGLEVSTSDLATSVTTGTSSPVAERTEDDEGHLADSVSSENRRTLAERLLPKPRKTGVEDLLEEPDYPEVSRVMRIKPRPDEQPAAGFSWADYEDVDSRAAADDADGEDDGGWGVVKSRGRQRVNKAPSDTSAPAVQKSSESLTKKQRQHAAKREAQKAAKAEAEQDRLTTLAKHKRELERTRMAEQAKTTKKTASGGMSAYVDENGKLVWQ